MKYEIAISSFISSWVVMAVGIVVAPPIFFLGAGCFVMSLLLILHGI